MTDVKKLKTFLFNVLICSLLTSFGQLRAQFAINGVTAEDQVQFANNPSFEIGNLTIKVKLPSSKTTAEVTVTLPTGIEYVVGSATLGANAASVTYQTSSPVSKPVFTMVGTAPNTEVTFTIKRKITKTATDALDGKLLTDKVKVAITGEGQEEKDSNPYRVTPPVVTVKGVTSVSDAPIGENTTTFGIRNTGVGATRTIFFSVAYPAGITHVSFTPPPLVTLDQVGTVPTGFENAGQPMYRLTKPSGFLGNELVTITQKYQIAASLCGGQLKIGYEPYWGLSATDIFGKNTKVDRNIKVRTYSPKMIQTSDTNKRYFEYGAGLCAATGQKFGTFYTAFKNNSTDAIAYNNRIEKLWQVRTYFNLTNFCIIATDGTKIPIAETSNDGNTTKFDFSTNAALLTTNAALTGKDIGFTDEDGDGHLDDLKPGAEIRICYDLVSKGIPFACNALSINPSYTYLYDNACGESIQLLEAQGTYRRAYGRINKSIFPAQLLLNAPEKGYLSPGMTSVAAEEQLQGQGGRTNDLRYRYYMQLPSGVGLKNVVFHYTLNDDFTDTTAPIVSIGNIPAGGVLDFTTPNTPPAGVTSGKERLWGHISFELELSNCTGMSSSATIPYKISMMSRNQDGTTFCEIPIVCESASVSTGCSVPCTVKGPEMLSTKVERADNSYGWTDDTMTTRVQRANVSAEQRRKVLPLDTVEFFAEGKQTDQAAADNLFYYVAVKKNADLLPKSIKVTIGAQETILQASAPGVVTRANDTNGNYYRWDLTSALPAGTLAAGQTFSIVATYQASNATENQDLAEQSGITSYFYTLANKNDTAINAQGVHTNALRCGVALIPVFDFGRTGKWNGMNGFILNGCYPINVGGYYIHLGRNQASGSLLYEEYRPGILMKKIVLKMPLAYKITENPEYYYTADAAQARNNTSSSVIIPLNKWVETTEGNKRVYTYTNPTNTADPYFLRPGMIAARTYNEWLKVMVQASCKSKEFTTGTDADKLAAARAADEVGYYQIEAEDLYYHYADNPTPPSTNIANNSVFLLSAKPQLLMAAQGQGSTIRANKNEQSAVFALEARNNKAPNTWISIPDVTGVEVLGLEEVNDAAGTTVVRTLTPETNITGEKMFFLKQIIQVGAANQKYYRLKFKLTNCSQPQIKFKVYAGWNCDGDPTQGYRATCDDTFLEYTVNIAQSKKDIEVGGNPTSLTMCAKTPFSYIVKSTDEGDIFGANLVVTQQPGIVISDVKVEYPLNSGKVYNTSTPVDGKIIGVTTVGGKTTYQLFDILTDGSLPGSVSTNVEDEQKFKVTFNVQPDCDFVAGSSFAIDLEGNNLCGVPAIGPKIVENVAGIAGATVNDYNMLLSSINYQIGTNANACDSGAIYKVKVVVNATPSNPLFTVGNDARLHIRFPQSYDIQNSDITIDRSAFPQANPSSSWADPTVESRGVVGGENEIIMKVPAGMKDTHYFEVMVKIKQKANTAVSCTDERDLKVLTTDKITTVFCSTLGANCPALIVSTSPEKKAKIENKRASLSLADVKVSSTVQGNKEKLTVKYKVTNAATAEALYNGSLKVSLYHDVNGNGLVDAGDTLLKDNTQNENIAIGATSPERSFTYVADQSEVCRLLLAIKDNYCLCDNVVSLATPPAEITGLISDATICESDSKVLTYVPAPAPVYQAYTWEAVSPANALDYLSATNTALPTFHYTGAKLTTTTEFKYKLKVKRTNGCESAQEVKLTVKPAPSITTQPIAPANPYCTGTTAATLTVVANDHGVAGTLSYEWYESTTNAYNGTLKGSSPTYTPPTNAAGIKYYYVKVENTGCGKTLSNIIMVKTNATPTQPTVAQDQAAGCGTVSTAKVSNRSSYASGITFKVTKGGTPVSATVASNGTINGISEAGTYVIKAVEDGCESAGTTFTIADKKPVPDKPTLTLTAESCTSATVAKITNHAAGKTYTFIKSSNNSMVTASVDGTGKITSLPVGKYKIKATQGGCTSELSDEFEIKAQKAVPAKPAITLTAETCASPTIAKITNYDPNQTYWLNGTQLTVTLTGEIQHLGVGSHTITAKNGSCESAASDSFTIKAKKVTPVKPTVAEDTAATCSAISTAKVSNYNANFTYTIVESANTNNTVSTASVVAGGKITGLPVGKYKVKATKDGCISDLSDEFEIKGIKPTPAKPIVAEDTAATCTAISIAKLTNYDANFTYTFIKSSDGSTVSGVTMASDGKISGLSADKYKVKATKDGCTSDLSDEFEIKAVKPTPAVPTVSEHTAATCAAISIAKLNYTSGFDYIFVKSDDNTEVTATSVDNTGKISGLSVGKYKVKAKKDGCESALSAEFEIKDKLPTPAAPTIGEKTAATCTAISVAKVDNYSSYSATDVFAILDSSNTVVATALVASDGTINGLTTAGTYKITVTNTQGCTSAEATITIADVLPVPATPTPTATQSFCNSATVADLAPQGTDIKWYDAATGGSLLTSTTALVHNNKYYAARTLGSCESPRAEVTVKIISLAQPTLAAAVAPTCTAEGKAKITNYDPNATYTFTKADGTAVTETITIAADGIVTGLVAGSYKVKASKDGCEATSADFQIADKLPAPAAPTIGEKTAATCTAISVAKVTDYDNGLTYTIKDSANATVGNVENDGTISGLTAAGSYKITATNTQGCTSAEATITINPVQAAPAKPAITLTPASCTSPTVAKLTNQALGLTYWHNGTQLTVNPITHEIIGLAPGTYTITAKNNNNCESVASDSFEIKAQQTATTITTAPVGATYQKGTEATPLAVVATGEGTLSYKWYKNTDNNNTSGTEVGDNSPSYKPATDRVGTFYYWVEVTSNCGAKKSTVAEIKVVEGAPTIEANDDPDTTVRRGQEVAVLVNDKVNGNPATPADVDITISNDGGLTRVGVNPATGKIMIPNDAAPATYEITYKICVKNQPTICAEAKVKITVEVPTLALKAVDDDFGKIPNAVDYTTTNTVFSAGVDTMEGVVGNLSPERDVVLTPGAQPHENITMNPNGSITVKRGTPKGTYTYEYTICQKDVPTNCDKAKVSFEVIEAHIFAKDDGVWEVGTEGALTPSVLNNDIIGERVGIAPSEVTITETNGKPVMDKTKMVMNEDGRISVKKGIAEGTYTYYYTITEKANTANTSSASVTIRVVSFSAQDDEFDITNDKTKEFKTESVLKNDELNKKKNPSPVDDVILTKGEAKDAERNPTNALTMNDDGTITIAPNTPDGVYTYTYTICKKSAPTECKSAEAVIKLLPALIANDDDFTANPINPLVKEGIAGNVLDNDRYADGNALEHLDKVEITMLEGQESRANIEPNGNVVIPQGAPAGEYTLTYSLCMKDHPTICAEAKVKIVILEDKPLVIHNGISANGDGVNDGFMIEHIEGYPKNNLKIFNRWGVLVYEKDGYTNSEPFDGHSNGRATISAESKLPQGTYYYILEYQDTAEQTHTKKGWLYLKY